jgi:hypothetical protein
VQPPVQYNSVFLHMLIIQHIPTLYYLTHLFVVTVSKKKTLDFLHHSKAFSEVTSARQPSHRLLLFHLSGYLLKSHRDFSLHTPGHLTGPTMRLTRGIFLRDKRGWGVKLITSVYLEKRSIMRYICLHPSLCFHCAVYN